MSQQSLEQLLQGKDPVDLVRNSQIGAYVYPVVASNAMPPFACVMLNWNFVPGGPVRVHQLARRAASLA